VKAVNVNRRRLLVGAVLAAAVAATGAGAAPRAEPGLTATSILIGGTAPLSGEASSGAGVARGAEAYFEYVNARGGVHGRKIEYKYLDDGYDPGRTVQAIRQLVQQDRVFAIYNTLGTSNNLAIRPFLNQLKIPHLFVASGASTFGREARKYPWTIGFIPTYTAEGKIYAQHILKTRPRAKIAVLYQDDEYGKELLNGLRAGLGKKVRQIVRAIGYDPTATDVQSQIARLKASRADTFVMIAFGKFSIQSFIYVNKLNWHPQIYVNAVASTALLMQLSPPQATQGAISVAFGKDPASKAWNNDPGIKLFRTIMRRYAQGASLRDGYYAAGMASAYTLVDTIRRAGKSPTRQKLINQAIRLKEAKNPFLLPGIVLRTTPTSRYPIAQVRLQRWNNGQWQLFGPMLAARP
jgi:branched-chain amino acid transport system substrate-binding protein